MTPAASRCAAGNPEMRVGQTCTTTCIVCLQMMVDNESGNARIVLTDSPSNSTSTSPGRPSVCKHHVWQITLMHFEKLSGDAVLQVGVGAVVSHRLKLYAPEATQALELPEGRLAGMTADSS